MTNNNVDEFTNDAVVDCPGTAPQTEPFVVVVVIVVVFVRGVGHANQRFLQCYCCYLRRRSRRGSMNCIINGVVVVVVSLTTSSPMKK